MSSLGIVPPPAVISRTTVAYLGGAGFVKAGKWKKYGTVCVPTRHIVFFLEEEGQHPELFSCIVIGGAPRL